MQMPEALRLSILKECEGVPRSRLTAAAKSLSTAYRETERPATPRISPLQALAYAATRMPATYAAVRKVLAELPGSGGIDSVIDIGAGTGAGAWAVREALGRGVKITCVEPDPDMVAVGRKLTPFVDWVSNSPAESRPRASLVLMSYVLGEVKDWEDLLLSAWSSAVEFLVVLEPGTPRGFERIRSLRDFGNREGLIVAPCPHTLACPMAETKDWCHFAARVERTALHRHLKGGELSHEDEKFCYMIIERSRKQQRGSWSRIVRHPFKEPGVIQLQLCTREGALAKPSITKRSLPEQFRVARKADWGDRWEPPPER
jgi:ribosomal protein RSM22 (predicted rRNA methylase)